MMRYFVRVLEVGLGLRVLMKRMSVLKERWERVLELGLRDFDDVIEQL
jgi:hypothetical protein